jgi:hypothetical protein
MGGSGYRENGANDHEFHTFVEKYNAENNEISFYKDDSYKTTLTSHRPYDYLPLLISGRSYHNTNYLDFILLASETNPEPTINFGNEELALFENVMPGDES